MSAARALLPLRARHCIVTGAYGGIGAAIAQRFASEGALLTLIGRDSTKLAALCARLPPYQESQLAPVHSKTDDGKADGQKPEHSWDVLDVSSQQDAQLAMDRIWTRTGQIDVLVNAAGIAQYQSLERTSPEAAHELVNTNLMGSIWLSRFVAKRMRRRHADRDACIINISSRLAEKGGRGASVYAASKAGLIGFTHALAAELGPLRIRTNAILPGYIETAMLGSMTREDLTKRIPLGRLGTPAEVADAAVFLAQNPYANNCILNLDGGLD